MRCLAIECSDPGRSENLVTGEHEEIRVHGLDIDGQMGRGLGAVDQNRHAAGMGQGYDLLDRIDRAEGVRDMSDGDEFGSRPEQFLKGLEDQLSPVIDGHHPDDSPSLFRQQLPGNDVGVVLQFGEHDLVARPDVFRP